MLLFRTAAALAVAGLATFAPSAQANFPYTCDTVACFATWCADHLGDCRDGSPAWVWCENAFCVSSSGDITHYVAYCTLANSPVTCVI